MPGPCAVCNQPAQHTCGGCKIVNYCNKDHQKQHWKSEHKTNCKPFFKIGYNELLGRHLVATRNISKGELIFQEPPLVLAPKAFSVPICLGCHTLCDMSKYHECDGCGYPLCSVNCQVSDFHFDECRLMMEKKFRAKVELDEKQKSTLYFPIATLRCMLLKQNQSEKFKKIMDLQSHLEERRGTQLFALYKKNIAEFLTQKLKIKEFDEESILTIAGVLDTNAFEVKTKTSRLRGLYSMASMIAHSCKPNTKHTFHGAENAIAVSATTDIAEGELITATYTQTFWGTIARREHLRSVKCFDCSCPRCSDPTELGTYLGAIRCTRCATVDDFSNSPYMVSTEALNNDAPWKCTSCGRVISAKQIRLGNENLKEELLRIDKKNPQALENFLIKYGAHSGGVLHSKNSHVVQVKHALIQMYGNIPGFDLTSRLQTCELISCEERKKKSEPANTISDELLERKIEYCHDLLEVVDILDPGYSRIRGQVLNELQAAMAVQAKRQFNDEKITKSAAQQTLTDAMTILMEVIEILKVEPDIEELQQRLIALSKELDD